MPTYVTMPKSYINVGGCKRARLTKQKNIEKLEDTLEEIVNRDKMSLNDEMRRGLLEDGVIVLTDSIGSSDVYEFERELRYIKKNFPKRKEITVLITSPGGAAYPALALYDILASLKRDGYTVTTQTRGYAASAASMIVLQAGDKRIASPLSRFLLHEVRSWSMFETKTTSSTADEAKEMEALQDAILGILADRCHKSKEEVKKSFERKEFWMSAKEAKDYGLIDEIR